MRRRHRRPPQALLHQRHLTDRCPETSLRFTVNLVGCAVVVLFNRNTPRLRGLRGGSADGRRHSVVWGECPLEAGTEGCGTPLGVSSRFAFNLVCYDARAPRCQVRKFTNWERLAHPTAIKNESLVHTTTAGITTVYRKPVGLRKRRWNASV